ncbi:MAG: Fe-S cluster assembly protein SufD [Candidatus Obscuribacterales bacterium]|nr:Fe-S cluster assembly protein SufD [Candidatus Obscuribacterales bacterium]
MAELTMGDTIARETIEELASRLDEPAWLVDLRLAAREIYLQTPNPTERDEDWRRTDIGALDLTGMRIVSLATPGVVSTVPSDVPVRLQNGLNQFKKLAGVVVQSTETGGFQQLNPELAAKGVIFCDLLTAAKTHEDKLRRAMTPDVDISGEGKFALLTRALFNCGMFLYVPKGVHVDHPFFYGVEFGCAQSGASALFPYLLVVAEENTSFNLVYAPGATTAEAQVDARPLNLLAQYVSTRIGANSLVRLLEVHEYPTNVFMVGRSNCQVSRDARYETLALALGGHQIKSDLETQLQAAGASSDVLGIVLGAGNEKYSFNTIQGHDAPDTTSNINFRVALKDQSSSVYQGIVRVDKIAQRTNAFQSNKNLLLDGNAKADSIPKLEILADDVKCSHGATVGPVDREQIFYLTSRGLTEKQAEELVVLGFFRQVVEQFAIEEARRWLSDLVAAKIHGAAPEVDFFEDFEQ